MNGSSLIRTAVVRAIRSHVVKLTPSGLIEHARSDEGRKQLRYAAVSVVFVPLGQVLVQVLRWVFEVREYWAVLISACILTIPNYLANKFMVWRDKSKDNRTTEVIVFWSAAVLGTGFAMGFVWLAGQWFPEDRGKAVHGFAIFIAQLVGYGIVWVARYVFLDRWLFKATHHGEEPPREFLEDLHGELPL